MLNTTKPKVGEFIEARGMLCKIVRVHPFGTVDVETPNGRFLRITGLSFL